MTSRFDPMPTDQNRLFRELEKRVEALEARAGIRAPITELSQGVTLRGMAAPDTSGMPATDGKIYFKGGRLTARPGGNGSEVQLRPPVTIGDPGDVTAGDAGSTYSSFEQALMNQTKSRFNALLSTMRLNGLIV
ncbi:hypothetical protein ACFYUV_03950 [Nonomuraea sp. NPDC003560]|uniref:hypothetical protein n=1 Tax=Nonomuraea sp. NPDC003560 TaxID=3364341 RepID=UPI0036BFD298